MVVWVLIPCRVENSHCFGTALKGKIFSPGHTETSKYQNVHIYPKQKWLGFAIFEFFSACQRELKKHSHLDHPVALPWKKCLEKNEAACSSVLLSTRKRISAFLHCNALQPPLSKCPTLGRGLILCIRPILPYITLHCNALHGTFYRILHCIVIL